MLGLVINVIGRRLGSTYVPIVCSRTQEKMAGQFPLDFSQCHPLRRMVVSGPKRTIGFHMYMTMLPVTHQRALRVLSDDSFIPGTVVDTTTNHRTGPTDRQKILARYDCLVGEFVGRVIWFTNCLRIVSLYRATVSFNGGTVVYASRRTSEPAELYTSPAPRCLRPCGFFNPLVYHKLT